MRPQNTNPELVNITKDQLFGCKICNKTLKDIRKEQLDWFQKSKYRRFQRIERHLLEDHNVSFEFYLEKYLNIKTPKCKCGCEKPVTVRSNSSPLLWNCFSCGKNGGWTKENKEKRCGKGNPSFGKTPKHKNKTKENCETCRKISKNNKGKPKSKEHIEKSRQTRLSRYKSGEIKRFYGKDHWNYGRVVSEETKNKIRDATIKNLKLGKFKETNTKPHREFRNILIDMNIKYEEEKRVSYWLVDFYLIDYNIYIEVDGDYWHCNPKIYPNGPKNEIQQKRINNDLKKDKYFNGFGLKLIRFWEFDIYNNVEEVKEKLQCVLKK